MTWPDRHRRWRRWGELYQDGLSAGRIAKRYRVTKRAVLNGLEKIGCQRRSAGSRTSAVLARHAEIWHLRHTDKLLLKQIAIRKGMWLQSVQRILKNMKEQNASIT